jgi:DNA (cytosine-5)-methyltransferase 1
MPVSVAFDWDSDARASYLTNIGHSPVGIDVRDLLRLLLVGWSPGPVDLLVADPPCTPWSHAGKRRGELDERDMLGPTVEIIRLIRPTAALVANIPGLDNSTNWPVVQRTIGSLAPAYEIDFRRFDAADFGVPQHRQRPFWFCRRRGTTPLAWPTRTHGSPDESHREVLVGAKLRPWVTCREALGHLPPDQIGSPIRLRWRGVNEERPTGKRPRASDLDSPAGVVTTRENQGDGAVIRLDGPNHRPSNADAPARTVTRNTHGDGALIVVPHHGKSFLSSPNAVKLSEKAAAILQGFPASWVFVGKTKKARWSQIGQAMPAPLAEAVGRQILAWFANSSVPVPPPKPAKKARKK